jgi:serine protease Do
LSKSLNLDDISGVLVAKVEADTPAGKSGMKKGDVITSFNQKEIENVSKFRIAVAGSPIGEKLLVDVIRKGKHKTLNVVLVQRPEETQVSQANKTDADWLGMKVESVDGKFATTNKIDEETGVIISEIEANSNAERSELKVGLIIQEINGEIIKGLNDFRRISNEIKERGDDTILFYVKTTTGNYQYIAIEIKR